MTEEEISRRWTEIRERAAEQVRPDSLRAALRNPWCAAGLGAVAGLAVGYVLGFRRDPASDAHAAMAESSPGAAQSTGPVAPLAHTAVMNRLALWGLEKGIEALNARKTLG